MEYNCRIPCKIPVKNIGAYASELSKQGLCLRKYSKAVSKLEAKINVKQDADLREQKTLHTKEIVAGSRSAGISTKTKYSIQTQGRKIQRPS
ncbi:MAG: hypothetical protein QW253_04635 [Metallosphaera sp.]